MEGARPTIQNNNIYGNSNYNIHLGISNEVNATYNWWGTTDMQAISQSIFDNKKDFNLGTVTFVPFLTEPNPQATPSSTSTIPSPTPEIPEFPSLIMLAILVTATLGVAVGLKRKTRT